VICSGKGGRGWCFVSEELRGCVFEEVRQSAWDLCFCEIGVCAYLGRVSEG